MLDNHLVVTIHRDLLRPSDLAASSVDRGEFLSTDGGSLLGMSEMRLSVTELVSEDLKGDLCG